jgi:secreted Zn-dependent insulinase-like peptidase
VASALEACLRGHCRDGLISRAVKASGTGASAVLVPAAEVTCEYRAVNLHNGVRGIAVHDPSADVAAAAASIGVGHLQDPVGRPGLSHFLEHMAFLGSAKFPEEGGYKTFIKHHGGGCNASTGAENTTYYFQVSNPYLREALQRMGDAIAAPLLRPDAAAREVRAVDSEYRKNLELDSRRLFQLTREICATGHPWNRFGTGSAASICGASGSPEDACSLLRSHWERFYRGPVTSVAVVSKSPVEQTAKWIEEAFSSLSGEGERQVPWWLGGDAAGMEHPIGWTHPLSKEHGGAVGDEVFLRPVRPLRRVVLTFPMPFQHPGDSHRSATLASFALGHEGPRSLLAMLKKLHLATALSTSPGVNNGFTSLSITVTLTSFGDVHRERVIALCFAAIARLRESPVDELQRCWDEVRLSRSVRLWFRGMPNASAQAQGLSRSMQHWEPSFAVAGPALLGEMDVGAVSDALRCLGPANCVIIHQSVELQREGDTCPVDLLNKTGEAAVQPTTGLVLDLTEPWYSSKWARRTIHPDRMLQWGADSADLGSEDLGSEDLASSEGYRVRPVACNSKALKATLKEMGIEILPDELQLPSANEFLPTALGLSVSPPPTPTDPPGSWRELLGQTSTLPRPSLDGSLSSFQAGLVTHAPNASRPPSTLSLETMKSLLERFPAPVLIGWIPCSSLKADALSGDEPCPLRVWHRPGHFGLPKASLTAELRFPSEMLPLGDPKASVCKRLLFRAVEDVVGTPMYDAMLAGYSIAFSASAAGAQVVVQGFGEKLPRVLARMFAELNGAVQVDSEPFRAAVLRQREALERSLLSSLSQQPIERTASVLADTVMERHVSTEALLRALPDVSLEELVSMFHSGMARSSMELLVHGDVDREGALSIATQLNRSVRALGSAEGGRAHSGLLEPRVLLPPPGTNCVVTEPHTNPSDVNNAVRMSVFFDTEDLVRHCTSAGCVPLARALALRLVLSRLIDQPFFHSLRTQQQLGYIVRASAAGDVSAPRMDFYAQSSWGDVDLLEGRIREFLSRANLIDQVLVPILTEGTGNETVGDASPVLDRIKGGLLTMLWDADSRPSQEANRLWSSIETRTGRFLARGELMQGVLLVTPMDILETAQQFLMEEAPLRRSLCVRVHSTAPEEARSQAKVAAAAAGVDTSATPLEGLRVLPPPLSRAIDGAIATDSGDHQRVLGLPIDDTSPASPETGCPKWSPVLSRAGSTFEPWYVDGTLADLSDRH